MVHIVPRVVELIGDFFDERSLDILQDLGIWQAHIKFWWIDISSRSCNSLNLEISSGFGLGWTTDVTCSFANKCGPIYQIL